MKILRVNMRTLNIAAAPFPAEWNFYGNRGLIGLIMSNEVPPTCDPLGPDNKLIFAAGPLNILGVSSAGRLSAGGKSPLTKGIKESNSGGMAASYMVQQGYRAIIIEDKPSRKDAIYILRITADGCFLEDGTEYRGLGTHDLTARLQAKYGAKSSITCIGMAGEHLMSMAGIVNTDKDGNPSRLCARGGLGAVMGSKGLKAIIIDAGGKEAIAVQDMPTFRAAVRQYTQELLNSPTTSKGYPKYGTAAMMAVVNAVNALPTRSFRQGEYEHADDICGERMHDVIVERGGEGTPTHACMPGCVIRCSNVFPDEKGKKIVASLEYESLCLLGSNIDVHDFDKIAVLNYLCNDYGLDSIETGATIGICMDVGMIEFGDFDKAKELLAEIRDNTALGKILGNGASVTGRAFKTKRIAACKGQSFAAYDPRGMKGFAVTYATTPMGGDHTAGAVARVQADHQDPSIWLKISRDAQVKTAFIDNMGLCMFVGGGGAKIPGLIAQMLAAVYGEKCSEEDLVRLGKKIVWNERAFNLAAGLTAAADSMPEFMRTEALPPLNAVADVPLDGFWDEEFWCD